MWVCFIYRQIIASPAWHGEKSRCDGACATNTYQNVTYHQLMKNWKLVNSIAIKPPKDEEKCHMLNFIFSVGFPWSTHCIPMGNDSEPSTSMS